MGAGAGVRGGRRRGQTTLRRHSSDGASWERGWSGYRSVSAPRRTEPEWKKGQNPGGDAAVLRRRGAERVDEEQNARRKYLSAQDKDNGREKGRMRKAVMEDKGKRTEDERWRRRHVGFEALGLTSDTARALEIEGLGRPTRCVCLASFCFSF